MVRRRRGDTCVRVADELTSGAQIATDATEFAHDQAAQWEHVDAAQELKKGAFGTSGIAPVEDALVDFAIRHHADREVGAQLGYESDDDLAPVKPVGNDVCVEEVPQETLRVTVPSQLNRWTGRERAALSQPGAELLGIDGPGPRPRRRQECLVVSF